MTAKYYVVMYRYGSHSDRRFTPGALVVRESSEDKLWNALDYAAEAGLVPPEFTRAFASGKYGDSIDAPGEGEYVIYSPGSDKRDAAGGTIDNFVLRYDEAIGVGSVQEAFATAAEHGVTAPHLYRTTARGGLQPIAIGSTSAPAEFNPGRVRNSHDPDASTESMIARLQIGVDAIEHANKAKRANDLRAALGTAQWELGQAWTHGEYANLSKQDKGDVRAYLMELGMLVHEWIADDKRPTASQVQEARDGAERLAEFVGGRSRAANPRRACR